MSILVNFPMVNQRDGSLNGDFDCVPTSIAAGLFYLTGKRYTGTQILNATPVYGPSYQGPTAADNFVSYCDAQGVKLYPLWGDPIVLARQELAKGHPVIFTQQDDYSVNPNFTHVCVWYADGGGGLTAMDPFGGFPLFYTDDVWRARLREDKVWIMEKKSMVPNDWRYNPDTGVLTAPNGVTVRDGFAKYILGHNWDSANQPLAQEEAANPVEEGFTNDPPSGTRQVFNFCELGWNPKRGVWIVGVGNELKYVRKDRDNIKAQLAAAQAQLAVTQNQDINQLRAENDALKKKIEADKTTAQALLSAAQNIINNA